jgi:3-methyl-2-oxobutanoate hydroxymethyltransferase
MAGMRTQGLPRFVKLYADMRTVLSNAAKAYREDVEQGTFPDKEHSF